MTPEWMALFGLFAMVIGLDSRQDYEKDKRHLYRWAIFSTGGVALFLVGAVQATSR